MKEIVHNFMMVFAGTIGFIILGLIAFFWHHKCYEDWKYGDPIPAIGTILVEGCAVIALVLYLCGFNI